MATIEIPTGTSNKYEMEDGKLVLSRVLYSPVKYPAEYGYVEDTIAADQDPLDILVVISEPTFPGCRVPARVIGALRMSDDKGLDYKILAVCDVDPRYDHVDHHLQLGQPYLDAITHFFQIYKTLEGKDVEVGEWLDRDAALAIVAEARETARGAIADRARGAAPSS